MLPLDGSDGLFVRLPISLPPRTNTLRIQLVPKVRRWLADVLPEQASDEALLVFQRHR